MARNKESKAKKGRMDKDTLRKMGGVGFTMEDVQQVKNQKSSVNAKAYELMVEAMSVSANYMGDTVSDEGIRMDDVYPTTLEETLKMDALLDQSERAVKDDTDEEYNKMICELRGIVGWSRRRHFNFSWGIILGSLITIGAVVWMGNDSRESRDRAKAEKEMVAEWSTEADTITLDQALKTVNYQNNMNSPLLYKAWKMNLLQSDIKACEEHIEMHKHSADTASTKAAKERYLGYAESNKEKAEEYTKELEEVKGWSMKDSKEHAVDLTKARYKHASRGARRGTFFMIVFLLLIPLYIFANHSWGYVITRTREEQEKLEKIKRWGYGIAAGMFGLAGSISLVEDYRGPNRGLSSNDGNNAINAILMTIKLFLLAAAIILLAVVSLGIMVYSIIVGLKRNYDWKAIFAEMKNKGGQAAELAKAASDKLQK